MRTKVRTIDGGSKFKASFTVLRAKSSSLVPGSRVLCSWKWGDSPTRIGETRTANVSADNAASWDEQAVLSFTLFPVGGTTTFDKKFLEVALFFLDGPIVILYANSCTTYQRCRIVLMQLVLRLDVLLLT